ncbi:hypothetical protein NKH77_13890 [Streptomyces sp. M19]
MPPGAFGPYGRRRPAARRPRGPRIAVITAAVVVAASLVVGGIVLATGDDGDDEASGKRDRPASSGSRTPSASNSPPARRTRARARRSAAATGRTAAPTLAIRLGLAVRRGAVRRPQAGPVLRPPGLDSSVSQVETRSCASAHDGEVITNETLTGDFDSEQAIQSKALQMCETDAKERMKTIPNDGKVYYYYALYPALATYDVQGEDQVSCALTLSSSQDGLKLKAPLAGDPGPGGGHVAGGPGRS